MESSTNKSHFRLLFIIAVAAAASTPTFFQYYWYDDGILLNLGRKLYEQGFHVAFSLGFHNHFRPLPILLTGAIYYLFDPALAWPWYLAATICHLVNIILIWKVFGRVFNHSRFDVAFFIALLFSIHWAATEPMRYLSAIGVSFSLAGGLTAYLFLTSNTATWAKTLGATFGFIIALAGGEYGVACYPLVLTLILVDALHGKLPLRKHLLMLLPAFFVLALYIGWQLTYVGGRRVGTVYSIDWHILWHIQDNVGRLFLPSALLNEPLSAYVLVAIVIASVAILLRGQRRTELLVVIVAAAGIVGCLSPFAPSLAGNYLRFTTIAFVPFAVLLWHIVYVMAGTVANNARNRRNLVAAALGTFILVNGIYFFRESGTCIERGTIVKQSVQEVADKFRDNQDDNAIVKIKPPDVEHLRHLMPALGILKDNEIAIHRRSRHQKHDGVVIMLNHIDPESGYRMRTVSRQ